MSTNTEESYILREYYKGFQTSPTDIPLIKSSLKKIKNELILSRLIEQNNQIYNLISENYPNTYEILDQITSSINKISKSNHHRSKTITNNYQNNKLSCEIRYNNSIDDDNISTNNNTLLNNKLSSSKIISGYSKKSSYNYNNSTSLGLSEGIEEGRTEPFAVKKLNSIIYDNKNKIDKYKNELIDRKNIIRNKKKVIKEKFDDLEIYVKERDKLIEEINEDYKINVNDFCSLGNLKLISILLKDFLNVSDSQMKFNDDSNKVLMATFYNNLNKKSLKKALYCIDENKLISLSDDDLNEIKTKLNEIKDEIDSNNGSFFNLMYRALNMILIVTNIKNEIAVERFNVANEEQISNRVICKINELKAKNKGFENAKNNILSKYTKSFGVKNEEYLQKIKNRNSCNNLNSLCRSVNKDSIYLKEERIYQDNNNNNDDTTKSINELKILISKLENNYIALLKDLSKKIIKPKHLLMKSNK